VVVEKIGLSIDISLYGRIEAMKCPRSHAVEQGRRLVAQDLHRALGGQAFPGSFRGSHYRPFSSPHGFADGGAAQQPPAQMPPGYSNYAASPTFGAPFLGI
jgi:hypothetical protein